VVGVGRHALVEISRGQCFHDADDARDVEAQCRAALNRDLGDAYFFQFKQCLDDNKLAMGVRFSTDRY
jgi:hypothetical protein